nr:hypothetical protein [Tanacetum cinerariifolium]
TGRDVGDCGRRGGGRRVGGGCRGDSDRRGGCRDDGRGSGGGAEAVAVESEAGLEATIKAEEEAVEAAEKAAEVEAGLGARIGKALGGKIEAGLKGAQKLLKGLTSKAGDLILLKMVIDKVPKEHRKELAGWAMLLAAGGNKLA